MFLKENVQGIRLADEVVPYVSRRYNLTEERVQKVLLAYPSVVSASPADIGKCILHWTGGIPAVIHRMFLGKAENLFEDKCDEIMSTPGLFRLATAILGAMSQDISVSAEDSTAPWPIVSVTLNEAILILDPKRESTSVARQLYEWVDCTILYMDALKNVSFTFPEQLRRFRRQLNNANRYRQLFVLALAVQGFDGRSAGHSNEFLGDYLHTLHGCATNNADNVLVLNAESGHASWQSERTAEPLRVTAVVELNEIFTKWRSNGCEQGLDRVYLRFEIDTDGSLKWFVYGVQFKSGMMKGIITDGNLATQRANYAAHKKVDDATIAGILLTAELGFGRLIGALQKCFPGERFEVGDLTIYTTKKLGAQVEQSNGCHEFGDGVGKFDWTIKCGTEWVKQVLPEDYNRVLFP